MQLGIEGSGARVRVGEGQTTTAARDPVELGELCAAVAGRFRERVRGGRPGARARDVHGFEQAVALVSAERLTATIALVVAGWCGVQPRRG